MTEVEEIIIKPLNFIIQANSSISLLSLLDNVALNLRLNKTVSSPTGLIRMQIVYCGSLCF